MIIYNVTISLVDPTIQEEWLLWMKTKHIPDVMNTGCFLNNKICKLMVDDEITYAIQYTCKDLATLEKYQTEFSPSLQTEHTEKYRGKFGAFRSLLEIVHEQ
tara:strand:+ start:2380 stop:2685 length:306 start_codon:yes stop_codon:yes gene_type:complete